MGRALLATMAAGVLVLGGAAPVAPVVPHAAAHLARGTSLVRSRLRSSPTARDRSEGALLRYERLADHWDAVSRLEPAPRFMQWHSLRVDGVRRRYLLSLPAASTPAPLVIGFHGLGQRASQFEAQTELAPATRAAGEALALPESLGPAFNDGRLGPGGPADDAFALALVRHLAEDRRADPGRVTVTGFSNGAGMAMQFADSHPDRVASVVSVSGDMIAGEVDGSPAPRPTSPVRAVLIHGTDDRVQPWRGRSSRGITWPAYISVPSCTRVWAHTDRAEESTREVVDRRVDGHTHEVRHSSYVSGLTGAPVDFYAVVGMRHRWPVTTSSDALAAGDEPAAVSATAIVVSTARAAHARLSALLPQPRSAQDS